MAPLRVLVVATRDDIHARAVLTALTSRHVAAGRISAESLKTVGLTWKAPSHTEIQLGPRKWTLNQTTSVWWRRPGRAETRGLQDDEALLVAAEARAAIVGSLMAADVRWVDRPDVIQRAEVKQWQIKVAIDLGLRTPRTMVTNRVGEARSFVRTAACVAKSLSSGPGLAPYVDTVPGQFLRSVSAAPTQLQELIPATADIRIATVGGIAFQWSRPRAAHGQVDWRRYDPRGRTFVPSEDRRLAEAAPRLARALGLSFSVQDWLMVGDHPVFLEVNPQGNWLFLRGSRRTVAPAMANYLAEHER